MIKIMIKGDPEGIAELVAALQVHGGKARETERIGAEIFDHAKEVAKAELWDRVFSEYAMRGEPQPPETETQARLAEMEEGLHEVRHQLRAKGERIG